VIAPAISVLSAVEGLEMGTPALHPFIVPLALGILVALSRYGDTVAALVGIVINTS